MADKIIRMANAIAGGLQVRADRDEAFASHINNFWAPTLRVSLLDLVARRQGEFHPLVISAAPLVRVPLG